jgi:hypothetical protein
VAMFCFVGDAGGVTWADTYRGARGGGGDRGGGSTCLAHSSTCRAIAPSQGKALALALAAPDGLGAAGGGDAGAVLMNVSGMDMDTVHTCTLYDTIAGFVSPSSR